MFFYLIPRRLLSSSASSAVADFWRLLRSNYGRPSLDRILSLSPSRTHLTASVVESVLRQSAAAPDDGRSQALRFFVWAGLQPRLRHSTAAYASACDALLLQRRPHFLSQLLDSYRAEASPVCTKTFNILLNLCRHANLPDEAVVLLRRMSEFDCRPDTSSYNTVIRLLGDSGSGASVAVLLKEMEADGLIPDMVTYVSAVRALSASGQIEAGRSLIGQMRSTGCVPNVVVYSALLNGACAHCNLQSAIEILGEMENNSSCAPNVVSYTCLIKCLCENRQLDEALGIFDRMEKRGCSPNQTTVRTLVDGFCARQHLVGAQELVDRVSSEGKVSPEDCYSVFVVCLLRIKDVERAEKVLRGMLEKGVRPNGMACNSLMRELCGQMRFRDAYNWLLRMEDKGLDCIDSDVYSSLLQGICHEGHLVEAVRVGAKVVEKEICLQEDCADSIVKVFDRHGEHAMASQIMRLKQPRNDCNWMSQVLA